MEAAIRLALVDDHDLFRYALGSVLRGKGFEMVAEAGDARSSFAEIDRARPSVVLLDVGLPGMDGITAAHELSARPAKPKLLMLSAYGTPHVVSAAFSAGALGYALKSTPFDQLIEGIRLVAKGERYLGPGLSEVASLPNGPLSALTARERDIFRLIAAGRTTPEIARQLCISVKTVETHRQRIFRKLDVHSGVQLVRFAVMNDLLLDRTPTDDFGSR